MTLTQEKFLHLRNISAYRKSFNLSNNLWEIVLKWDRIAQDTVGKQMIRSMDSISANIAEGFGRYHKKDKEKFYYNARGSTYESLDWLQKAKLRNLVSTDIYNKIFATLSELPKEINSLIRYTETHLEK